MKPLIVAAAMLVMSAVAGGCGGALTVERLPGSELDPLAVDENGWTRMHWAAAAGDGAAIRKLAALGADPDAAAVGDDDEPFAKIPFSPEGRRRISALGLKVENWNWWENGRETPLHVAARFNRLAAVSALIEVGADVSAGRVDDETPLHWAARGNAGEAAELLLKHGADANADAFRHGGMTCLPVGCVGEDCEPWCGPPSRVRRSPLHLAAQENAYDVARLLLERGGTADAEDDYGATPLLAAVMNNAHETAELLLKHGADVRAKNDFFGWTPLHLAAWINARETAELLLEHGADVNAKGEDGDTPLHWTISGDFVLEGGERSYPRETAELLLQNGADVRAKGRKGRAPLHLAAWENEREAAELLLKHGADVHAKDNNGDAPLHLAAWTNARETAELLLEHGADVGAKDGNGDAPLHDAADNSARETVELLLEHGADVNAKDGYGNAPLHLATWETLPPGVVLIGNGDAPLHWAAGQRARETVELLLKHGADVNAKDHLGRTPLDFAIEHERSETQSLLREHGGVCAEHC